jgi:hypothetical protein
LPTICPPTGRAADEACSSTALFMRHPGTRNARVPGSMQNWIFRHEVRHRARSANCINERVASAIVAGRSGRGTGDGRAAEGSRASAWGDFMTGGFLLIATFAMLLADVVLAHAQTFGSWFVGTKRSDFLYALSINDSGNVLGQFCYPGDGSCIWLIALKTGCQKGDHHPVLANSDAGSVHLDVLCDGQLESGLFRYAFTNFDQVDNIVRQGTRVGFALPLQKDEFRVVRFDLSEAASALATMRAAAEKKTLPVRRGTRDEKL